MGSPSRRRQPHFWSENPSKPRVISRPHEYGWQRTGSACDPHDGLWEGLGRDASDKDIRKHTFSYRHTDRRRNLPNISLAGLKALTKPSQLALKHRQNKSQRQRIIVFTCSPIAEDEKSLVKLAKRMKKNNVSIDFVAFGDLDPENTKKLEAFNENIKGGDGSHLAIIPPGPSLLSDHLVSSPILAGEGVGPRGGEPGMDGGATGGGNEFEFGVDPSTDPELALALRMSMEEEKARQEKEGKADGAKEPTLEGIPEEGGESQPLLNADGEASGSVDAPVEKPKEAEPQPKADPEAKKENEETKKGEDGGRDEDTMDIA